MAEKRVSVRLVAEGGRQVRAELAGIGEAGSRGFGRLSSEMELANARLGSFARKAGIALAAVTVAAAAAGVAMIRSGLSNVDAQAKLAQSMRTTVESVQTLTWAGELAGVSMGEIEQATKKLTTRLSDLRSIDAVRQDRAVYDLPPGEPRPATLSPPTVFGTPDVVLLDLPQLREDQPAHRPFVAAHAKPWPGEIAVYRSAATDGFALLTTFSSRARIGVLAADFYAGPVSRFDLGNALVVDLFSGTLESVTDITLFGGANALAVETNAGEWEIVQAGNADLIAPGRYRLTRLLRGQRGTEGAIVSVVPTGARVVVLDSALASLPIAEADLGLPWNWRIGPASKPVSDETFVVATFTPEGAGLRPFSPAHLRAAHQPDGAIAFSWIRRTRDLAGDSWVLPEVPLGEISEAYDLDVRTLEGALVRSILGLALPAFTYSAEMIASDLAGLSPIFTVRVFQIGRLGRGAPAALQVQL